MHTHKTKHRNHWIACNPRIEKHFINVFLWFNKSTAIILPSTKDVIMQLAQQSFLKITLRQVVFTAVCQAWHVARGRRLHEECWARSGPAKCHIVTPSQQAVVYTQWWQLWKVSKSETQQMMSAWGQRSSKTKYLSEVGLDALLHSLWFALCCLHPESDNLKEKNTQGYTECISLGRLL